MQSKVPRTLLRNSFHKTFLTNRPSTLKVVHRPDQLIPSIEQNLEFIKSINSSRTASEATSAYLISPIIIALLTRSIWFFSPSESSLLPSLCRRAAMKPDLIIINLSVIAVRKESYEISHACARLNGLPNGKAR